MIKNFIKKMFNYSNYRSIKKINLLRNKDVFILGSAPNPDLSGYSKKKILITCNGSAANAKKLKMGQPLITIVDNELLDKDIVRKKESRKSIINGELLKSLNLGTIISVQSNHSQGSDVSLLQSKYSNFYQINKQSRLEIIDYVTNTNLLERNMDGVISTGAFAFILSFFLGAKSVSFSGFRIYQKSNTLEHFYKFTEKKRNIFIKKKNIQSPKAHSLADSAVISILKLRGYKIKTDEIEFLHLLNNWGNYNLKR